MLSFGTIISLEIDKTHTKDQHHHMCQDQEADAEGHELGTPKNLYLD